MDPGKLSANSSPLFDYEDVRKVMAKNAKVRKLNSKLSSNYVRNSYNTLIFGLVGVKDCMRKLMRSMENFWGNFPKELFGK